MHTTLTRILMGVVATIAVIAVTHNPTDFPADADTTTTAVTLPDTVSVTVCTIWPDGNIHVYSDAVDTIGQPTPCPAGMTVEADPVPTVSYEMCEEDEILAPTDFAYQQYEATASGALEGVGESITRYVCVNVQDFADPDSIARLDAIIANRQNGE